MINAGDTAWVLISAAMVMFMTPGLALFYGGMVRRKNLLSTIMMSFACIGLVTVLWMTYGYSIGFAPGIAGGLFGNLEYLGLNGVGQEPSAVYATTVPHLAFMAFQGMFAVIALALITGAVVERMKFSALLVFGALWLTFIYCPVAHWVWGDGGWLARLGALDFAGGAVVHINAGVSALALVILLGKRRDFTREATPPSSVPMVVTGSAILWFGWFGFNAGSALGSNGLASSAFVSTHLSAAAAALTWMIVSWSYKKPTLLGTATGAVAGLVAITPAAGFVEPIAAIPIGVGAPLAGFYGMKLLKEKLGFDDSLDVFAVHGLGGVWGAVATGIFASAAVNPAGADGLVNGGGMQVVIQMISVVAVAAFAFIGSIVIGKVVNATVGLRVKPVEETIGLDLSQHAESVYGGSMR
ncbi:MAG: ammonium transporter [Dehalococcoidales bacterium]|nr:ammonium transporter [Dehalococcoidales bacterium]